MTHSREIEILLVELRERVHHDGDAATRKSSTNVAVSKEQFSSDDVEQESIDNADIHDDHAFPFDIGCETLSISKEQTANGVGTAPREPGLPRSTRVRISSDKAKRKYFFYDYTFITTKLMIYF